MIDKRYAQGRARPARVKDFRDRADEDTEER